MANPDVQTLDPWVWVKVASGVITGTLNRLSSKVSYYQTYRVAGGTAPDTPTVGTLPEEAVKIFGESNQEEIESSATIDVYILCFNSNSGSTNTGLLRVDI